MKVILLLALVTLSACGNGSSSSPRKERSLDPLCGSDSQCEEAPAWTVTSSAVNFPKKFQIFMDEILVADNCRSTRVKVAPDGEGRIAVRFNATYRPERIGTVKVVDRGETCDNDAIYHTEERPIMSVVAVTVEGETTYTISVTLDN